MKISFFPNQSFLNLKNTKEDHLFLESAKKFKKINYPKPDNKISLTVFLPYLFQVQIIVMINQLTCYYLTEKHL